MSIDILKRELKENILRNTYLFYGDEQYLKRHYYNLLVKKAIGEQSEFNFTKLSGKTLDLDELSVNIESYPLMSEKKIVVIDDLKISGIAKDVSDALKEIIKEIPEYTILIIYEETVETDEKKADFTDFSAAISKSGLIVNFQKASESDLTAWSLRQFKSRNKIIDTPLVKMMNSMCDNDMTTLKNEIEKLCSYAVTETITKQQIDTIVTKTLDAKVFDLTDALLKPDYKAAFEILGELFSQGVEPTMIAGTVYGALIRLYKVKIALNSGLSKPAIAKALSMKEFAVGININLCRNVSADFLKKCILCCEKADRTLKSTKTEKSIVLERLLGEILLLESMKGQ